MSKRAIYFVFLICLCVPLNLYAQDNIDEKLFLNLKVYNVPFGGVISGLSQWLKNNYKVCSYNDVFVVRNDEGGDPDAVGCYIVYGPDDESLSQWTITSFILDNGFDISFNYYFDFKHNEFTLARFSSDGLTESEVRQLFYEVSQYEVTKRFGKGRY